MNWVVIFSKNFIIIFSDISRNSSHMFNLMIMHCECHVDCNFKTIIVDFDWNFDWSICRTASGSDPGLGEILEEFEISEQIFSPLQRLCIWSSQVSHFDCPLHRDFALLVHCVLYSCKRYSFLDYGLKSCKPVFVPEFQSVCFVIYTLSRTFV